MNKSCPCAHTAPCDPGCTCANPVSSRGCLRCCSYGSRKQQKAAAERIACAIDRLRADEDSLRAFLKRVSS